MALLPAVMIEATRGQDCCDCPHTPAPCRAVRKPLTALHPPDSTAGAGSVWLDLADVLVPAKIVVTATEHEVGWVTSRWIPRGRCSAPSGDHEEAAATVNSVSPTFSSCPASRRMPCAGDDLQWSCRPTIGDWPAPNPGAVHWQGSGAGSSEPRHATSVARSGVGWFPGCVRARCPDDAQS
jgi:hypothetical protein